MSIVLFVAILGASGFLGHGFVAGHPTEYQAAPGNNEYGNSYEQFVHPNQMQPMGGYYQQPPYGHPINNGPLVNGYPNQMQPMGGYYQQPPYGHPINNGPLVNGYPNQIQPMVGYYLQPPGDSRKNGPLIKGWDAAHDYGQNFWLALTGQM